MYTATPRRPAGFTLAELLVVIAILLLISVATLPVALVALSEREVSDAASTVQANFAVVQSRAVASGEAQGIRLLPDPTLNGVVTPILASNRMIALSTPPDHAAGQVTLKAFARPDATLGISVTCLGVFEQKTDPVTGVPMPPTGWYYNIRQGDSIRFGDASPTYTIAGPMTTFFQTGLAGSAVINPERFVNLDDPIGGTQFRSYPGSTQPPGMEILWVLNGRDDDGDGYIDEAFDGIDNDGDGITDPGFNGIDDDKDGIVDNPGELLIGIPSGGTIYTGTEFELEELVGISFSSTTVVKYDISRRPYVAPDAREVSLPADAVIDLTTSTRYLTGGRSERSRVPVDAATGYVDLVVYPNGEVIPSTPWGFRSAKTSAFPFYYLWIAERRDVVEPIATASGTPSYPLSLPLPEGKALPTDTRRMEGERRMVTISPNTGHASVSEIPFFATDFNLAGTDLTLVDFNGDGTEETAGIDVPFLEPIRHQQTGE